MLPTLKSRREIQTPAIFGGSPIFARPFRFSEPVLPPLPSVLQHYASAHREGLITNSAIVQKFEAAASEYLGVKHAVAVSSCTSGLMLVLRALDLRGEIILPSFTFFATGHAALWNGLRPVFADCDPLTWNIDPADVERKITRRTSAILGVHLYGNPCDVVSLTRLASLHGLKLVFDAAHAFGSRYRERCVGQFGDAEVFSLSPTKLLVAGEGGLVTTNDASLAKAVRAMRNYGDAGSADPDWLGMNARMPEFNAALALAGLPLLESKIRRRNEIGRLYTSLLSAVDGLRFQDVPPQNRSTFKDFSIHVTDENFGSSRDDLAAALLAENIPTKKYFYPPLHLQTMFAASRPVIPGSLAVTESVGAGILSLPIHDSLSDAAIKKISWAVTRLARSATTRKLPCRAPGDYRAPLFVHP